MRYYCITVDGKKNHEAAEKFLNGCCVRGIYNYNQRLADVEIVIPFGEKGYKVSNNKYGLISFSYIKPKNVELVLNFMKILGFSGIAFCEMEEVSNGFINYVQGTEFCTII